MQSISVFIDIEKFDDFPWKNADINRIQTGVSRFIHFLGSFLGKIQLYQVS